jgi:hypothetical protein
MKEQQAMVDSNGGNNVHSVREATSTVTVTTRVSLDSKLTKKAGLPRKHAKKKTPVKIMIERVASDGRKPSSGTLDLRSLPLEKKKRKRTEGEEAGDKALQSNVSRNPTEGTHRIEDDSQYIDRHHQRWEDHFQALLEYKVEHNGSTAVPQTYKKKPELGIWVHRQRTKYFDGSLRQDRKDRLNSVGFVWQVTKFVPWEDMYRRLIYYKQQFGTTQVPRPYKDDPALGYWVYNQRQKCKKKERIKLLNDIGFVWSTNRSSKPTRRK